MSSSAAWSSLATAARGAQHVALRLPARALLRVAGADARTWLQGLTTNNVKKEEEKEAEEREHGGEASCTAFLNNQVKRERERA